MARTIKGEQEPTREDPSGARKPMIDHAPAIDHAPMIDHAVDVRPLEPAQDAERDRYLDAHPHGTFFHLSGWGRLVERVFRHPCRDLGAWRGSRLVGVLPLASCRRPFGGRHLISVPYGVYGGPVGDDDGVERRLVEAATALGEAERVGRVELRCLEAKDFGLQPSELYATFIEELPDDPEDVLANMKKRARAEVRKARDRFGLEVSEGPWYVHDLVRLFNSSKQGLGSPGLPAAWFLGLTTELRARVAVHVARREGEIQAAMMTFLFRDTASIYYIGVADGANREFSATNFLTAMVKEWAVRQGYRRFDWSRSRKGSGAFAFKTHQGAVPQDLHYQYHLVRSTGLPSFNPSNPRTKILRDTWQRMPSWLATRLSKPLSRYLP